MLLFINVCSARLKDSHVIFEVDSSIFAKQLAHHLSTSFGLVVLKISLPFINNVHMFVIPFLLFTFRGTFVIFTVNSTRLQTHHQVRRLTSVIRMVFRHFGGRERVHLRERTLWSVHIFSDASQHHHAATCCCTIMVSLFLLWHRALSLLFEYTCMRRVLFSSCLV